MREKTYADQLEVSIVECKINAKSHVGGRGMSFMERIFTSDSQIVKLVKVFSIMVVYLQLASTIFC